MARYTLASSSMDLQGFYEAKAIYEELRKELPDNEVIKTEFDELLEMIFELEEKVRREEVAMENIPKAKLAHKWKPIEPLPDELFSYVGAEEMKAFQALWYQHKKDLKDPEKYLRQLQRSWAVETGRIEYLYTLSEEITRSLIINGISRSAIVSDKSKQLQPDEAVEIEMIISDQLKVIEKIYEMVKQHNTTITLDLIFQIHKMFTATARYTTMYAPELGATIKVLVRRGQFEVVPSSPVRNDGLIHQYCPPSKVATEMDQLLKLYQSYVDKQLPPEVLAAWLHHRFVQIHPFSDGNGRVARTLASLVLLKHGLLPFEVWMKDFPEYITALRLGNEGDLFPLIRFIVKQQCRKILSLLSLPWKEDYLSKTSNLQLVEDSQELIQSSQIANQIFDQLYSHLAAQVEPFGLTPKIGPAPLSCLAMESTQDDCFLVDRRKEIKCVTIVVEEDNLLSFCLAPIYPPDFGIHVVLGFHIRRDLIEAFGNEFFQWNKKSDLASVTESFHLWLNKIKVPSQ